MTFFIFARKASTDSPFARGKLLESEFFTKSEKYSKVNSGIILSLE
jgi:hypothetical protein